jgi:hypothetical protein
VSLSILVLVGLYLFGCGLLVGVVIDRVQFDRQRSEVLSRYEEALRGWHGAQMALENTQR